MSRRVLIVDDDPEMAETIADYLGGRDFHTESATGGKAALAALRRRPFDAVLTDLRMDDVDGLDVLAASLKDDPARPVLMMTAYGSIDGALEAMRRGAYHYLSKPFKMEEAVLWLERALSDRGLRRENEQLRKLVEERHGFHNLIGKSPVMMQIYDLLGRASPTTLPVLIQGESGTGKELVARALHFGGPRAQAPFVAINCAALPEALLESELFGHAKGAFTGAIESKKGLFTEADGGTLFLDEMGDLPLALQAKLLRVLEDGVVRPVGGGERKVNVRIIAATNRDLAMAVQERRFREDLYYRLHVILIHLPPLRARREDIPLLIDHFAAEFARQHPEAPPRELSSEVLRRLVELPWPGNVRELRNVVERLLLLARGRRIELRDVAQLLPSPGGQENFGPIQNEIVPLRVMTRRYIEWVLGQTQGNKVRAAQLLGIDASTIYRILAKGSDS
ncbi:MAG TPA: sigma-54 dependent transcriptional regulator [Polyangia bacterium]|jgi:two-component system response regulator HydG|nr:sigma-54 dependent transcriptional regulator [Polyangia bacterium]